MKTAINKKHLFYILCFTVFIRMVYILFSYVYLSYKQPQTPFEGLTIFLRNDGGWYRGIAENGYPVLKNQDELKGRVDGEFRQSEWAFFPAFPFVNKWTKTITHLSYPQSAFLVSFLFSLAAFLCFYFLSLAYYKDESSALWVTVFFIVFPFNYHFSMSYTEAPFFICMLLILFFIQREKVFYAIPFLIILTLLRPNGIIVAFAFWLYFLDRQIRHIPKSEDRKVWFKSTLLQSLYFLAAPIALAAWCWQQYRCTGDYFAFSTAQAGWEKENMFPVLALFRMGDITSQVNSFYICFFLLILLINYKKIRWSIWVLILLTLLIPLSKGTVTSMYRYMSVLVPFFLLLFAYFLKLQVNYRKVLILLLLTAQLYMFTYWLEWHTFSY